MKKLSRKTIISALTVVYSVLAVVFMVIVLAANWSGILAALGRLGAGPIAASGVAVLLATFANVLSWRSVVIAGGDQISVFSASLVMFTTQIGKYIPGGIWPVVMATQLGKRSGLKATTTAVTLLVQLLISLTVAGIVSLGAVGFVQNDSFPFWIVALVIPIALAVLSPPVLRFLLLLAFRVTRRADALPALSSWGLVRAAGWSVLAWILFGLHLWILVGFAGTSVPNALVLSISGFALSWAIGFLAVLAPAGAGVRELVLTALFGTVLSTSTVLAIVITIRFVSIVVDFVLFLVATIIGRARRPPGEPIITRATARTASKTLD